MKAKFSKSWKASKRPGKQRKYAANAPLHLKKKFVSTNLSKELRKKHGKRNLPVRKNDVVKIMRGKFKGKQGKVLEINLKKSMVAIEGIQTTKRDGTKANIMIHPSNLQIIEMSLEDKKRIKEQQKTETKEKPKEKKQNAPKKTKIA